MSIVDIVRLKEGEERRDKRKCLHYGRGNQNKCGFGNGECISTSQCPDYTEDKSPENVEKYYPGDDLIERATVYEADKDLFERALKNAQRHNVSSMFQVAQYYEHGRGVEKDYVQAMKWYKNSFFYGKEHGAVAVGKLYEKGRGTEKDLIEALIWYKKGEAVNEPGARERAARLKEALSLNGNTSITPPVVSSPKKTKKKPVPITDPWLLGQAAYEKERWAEAYRYFEQAAKSGKIEAVCRLADMYYDGIGIPRKDYRKAFRYYRQAAAQGHSYAMDQVRWMYLQGEGFDSSYRNVLRGLSRALDEGDQLAKDEYEQLFDTLQDDRDPDEKNEDSKVIRHKHQGEAVSILKDILPFPAILSFILIIMVLFVNFTRTPAPTSTSIPDQPKKLTQQTMPWFNHYTIGTITNPYYTTAEALMGEYNKDPQGTEARYKGKFIQLTGNVVSTGKFRNSDNKFVRVYFWKYGNKAYEVIGGFKAPQWVNNLKVGDSITILGQFEGAVKQPSGNVVSLQLAVFKPPSK